MTLEERFWNKVDKTGECWEWMAYRDPHGYGRIRINRRTELAHRVAFRLKRGDPQEKQVLHECDNPACVRPSHLFLGTQADNMRDMARKGRGKGGGKRPGRFSADDIKDIRQSRLSHRQQAKALGVDHTTIAYIRSGKLYAHIPL